MLQWVHSQGWPLTCTSAAYRGGLEKLQWLHGQGCPWNEDTCEAAAAEGDMEMLTWLHNHGCPWNEETCRAAAADNYDRDDSEMLTCCLERRDV